MDVQSQGGWFWNYEHDYSLNCTAQGQLLIKINILCEKNFEIEEVSSEFLLSKNVST